MYGYGFRTLTRISRFQVAVETLADSASPSLAELAADTGYSDQAHMTREFRALADLTPGQALAAAHGTREDQAPLLRGGSASDLRPRDA